MGFPYWMSDVMHGPSIPDGRRRRKTYLAAFIDDATRVVPYAAFAFSNAPLAAREHPPPSCPCSSRPSCDADCRTASTSIMWRAT